MTPYYNNVQVVASESISTSEAHANLRAYHHPMIHYSTDGHTPQERKGPARSEPQLFLGHCNTSTAARR